MKIYIAGKITDKENYQYDFFKAQAKLQNEGHTVLNPCCLPLGFEHHEYIHICKAMIDVCDAIYLLPDWKDSEGAKIEQIYGLQKNKIFLEIDNEKNSVTIK